jgi:hypothetical protein
MQPRENDGFGEQREESAEREARFARLDSLLAGVPQFDEDEVAADVESVVRVGRRELARKRRRSTIASNSATFSSEAEEEAHEADQPVEPPVRPDQPSAEDAEMGGEGPCQLHRWWDAEE